MKIQLNLSILLLTVFFISCRQRTTFEEKEIRGVIQRFDSAWQAKYPAALDTVLSPSYVYFTQSGGLFEREEVLKTAASDEYRLDSSERKILSWKTDGAAVTVNTIWIGTGIYRGTPFTDTQRCSITLIKKDGETRILSEHCTLISRTNSHY